MADQREVIIDYISTLLEGIKKLNGYNNSPSVFRDYKHFVDENNFPSLHVTEGGQPETTEHICFDVDLNNIKLLIQGRLYGGYTQINSLVEDVKTILKSDDNDYKDWMEFGALKTGSVIDSEIKEFQLEINIQYQQEVV